MPSSPDTVDAGPLTEVVLRDGTPAMLWPLLPTDRELLRVGYAELPERSRRWRFFTAPPELSDGLLRMLIDDVDGVEHVWRSCSPCCPTTGRPGRWASHG